MASQAATFTSTKQMHHHCHISTCGLLACMLLWCLPSETQAQQTLIGNVPLLTSPEQEVKIEPYYLDIIAAIDNELPEVDISTQIRPFSRSLREVSRGVSDFHMPALCVPSPEIEEYLMFGAETVDLVYFVIFSPADAPITRDMLERTPYQLFPSTMASLAGISSNERKLLAQVTSAYDTQDAFIEAIEAQLARPVSEAERLQLIRAAFPYHIEMERFQINLVDIPTYPGSSISSSLHRLLSGRIDAIIYPIMAIAPLIARDNLDARIHSALFEEYDVCYLVAKNAHGQAIKQMLDKTLKNLKEEGMFVTFLHEGFEAQEEWAKRYLNGWQERTGQPQRRKPTPGALTTQ